MSSIDLTRYEDVLRGNLCPIAIFANDNPTQPSDFLLLDVTADTLAETIAAVTPQHFIGVIAMTAAQGDNPARLQTAVVPPLGHIRPLSQSAVIAMSQAFALHVGRLMVSEITPTGNA